MSITVITPPAIEPVTLEEVKLWVRIDHDTEDTLLTSLITAARRSIEAATGRVLVATTFEYTLNCFPSRIVLPRSPVRSVAPIGFTDLGESDQAFTSFRIVSTGDNESALVPELGAAWPNTAAGSDVIVEFVAGYAAADDLSNIPEELRTAVLMTVASLYQHREPATYGTGTFAAVPHDVGALIAPYRRVTF